MGTLIGLIWPFCSVYMCHIKTACSQKKYNYCLSGKNNIEVSWLPVQCCAIDLTCVCQGTFSVTVSASILLNSLLKRYQHSEHKSKWYYYENIIDLMDVMPNPCTRAVRKIWVAQDSKGGISILWVLFSRLISSLPWNLGWVRQTGAEDLLFWDCFKPGVRIPAVWVSFACKSTKDFFF